MNDLRTAAANRLNTAQSALTSALEFGADTAQHHAAVQAAERDLALIEAQDAGQMQAAKEDIEAQVEEQARREVEDATAAIHAELVELAAIVIPDAHIPVALAMSVQRAGRALQIAQEAEAAAHTSLRAVQQRQTDLEAQRQAIVTRRAAGETRDDDAGKLLLIDADKEALTKLIDERRQTVNQATTATRAAQTAFDQARGQLQTAIATEHHRCLKALSDTVDGVLCRSAKATAKDYNPLLCSALHIWRPSLELRRIIEHGR